MDTGAENSLGDISLQGGVHTSAHSSDVLSCSEAPVPRSSRRPRSDSRESVRHSAWALAQAFCFCTPSREASILQGPQVHSLLRGGGVHPAGLSTVGGGQGSVRVHEDIRPFPALSQRAALEKCLVPLGREVPDAKRSRRVSAITVGQASGTSPLCRRDRWWDSGWGRGKSGEGRGCRGGGEAGRPGWMPRGSGSSFPLPKLLVLISNTDDFWGSHWAEPMLGLLGLFFGLRQSGSQLAWFFRSVC